MDTIFAQATAPGRAGVSIIRISGADAFVVAGQMCRVPKPGAFKLSAVRDGSGALIDRCLVLAFGNGASFTGEDVVELHLHGSIAIVSKVLGLLTSFSNCRLAKPGEFTRRALENGQLDLVQVEALSDLIDAETESQRLQAMRIFDGEFGEVVTTWRRDLIRAIALLEASIDFSDEEIPDDLAQEVLSLVSNACAKMVIILGNARRAEKIRTGFVVAIVGAPNVGKSTLLNAIAGREAAITSEMAGTTRDVIEVRIDINGLAVSILDTAGIRTSDDHIESLGIELAKKRAVEADLRIFLVEDLVTPLDLHKQDTDIVILNKGDQRPVSELSVSGATGVGVQDLLDQVAQRLEAFAPLDLSTIRVRQSDGLQRAVKCLENATAVLVPGHVQYELAAFEVRAAVNNLDFLLGKIDVETVLGEIFSSFCLGK